MARQFRIDRHNLLKKFTGDLFVQFDDDKLEVLLSLLHQPSDGGSAETVSRKAYNHLNNTKKTKEAWATSA